MNTIIIQPADPVPPIKGREGFSAAGKLCFAPSMSLMVLNSHININSRHKSIYVDTRTLADPIGGLLDEIAATPIPRVAVLEVNTVTLQRTVAQLNAVKSAFPDIHIGLVGQHATEYPEDSLSLPHVDFVCSGDPEPILKQYLDYIDLPQRLAKSRGLQLHGHPIQEPALISNISNVAPNPAWPNHFWTTYRLDGPPPKCEADIRITRGNTGLPPDRAFGEYDQPLRVFDFRLMSSLLERCSAVGVHHVNISDPPGVWSKQFLLDWANSLSEFHVRQSWGFQLLPVELSSAEHTALYNAWCKRVDFVFPSCDPVVLEKYGCVLDLDAINKTILTLKRHHIQPTIRYWIGGPEAGAREVEQIIQTIRALGYCDFLLQPFPYEFNSDLYSEYGQSKGGASAEDFMSWARQPERGDPPVPLWGGPSALVAIEKTANQILRKINRSPGRIAKRFREQLTHTAWIEKLETKSGSIDVIGPPTRDV